MSPFVVPLKDRVLELDECPRKAVKPASWDWIRLWHLFQQGHLPYAGGIMEQPARFMDAMEVIGGEKAEG